MFYFKGEYVSTILINNVPKLIAKIGGNSVFYNCMTKRVELIGLDSVFYDEKRGCIAKIGTLDVLYDAVTGRMTKIGSLPVIYDSIGRIVQIGDSAVLYVDAPTRYEAPQGNHYSPIQSEAPLRNWGLGYESANRLKMEGFIADLAKDSNVSSALFKIRYNLEEQSKARAKNEGLFDGYFSAALEGRAIQKVAQLLCHGDPKIRCRVRKALLVFPETVQNDDLPALTQQLKSAASLIINATINTMSTVADIACYDEMKAALEVFFILPFADQEIQALLSAKNVVPLLNELRDSHSALSDIIDKNMGLLLTSTNHSTARNLADELTEVDLKSDGESVQETMVRQSTNKLDNKSSSSSNPDLPNPSKVTVEALKVYYYAHSIWSKKKKQIFKNGADLNGVVDTLRTRADQRPGYASDKTLSYFKLK